MVKPLYAIVLIIILVVLTAFAVWAFGIPISTTQITLIVFLVLGIGGVAIFIKFFLTMKPKIRKTHDMDSAWDFASNWWKKQRNEDITYLESRGVERWFGKEKFIAFRVNRVKGSKAGLPIVLIVGTNPMRIADWDDDPDPDRMVEDPYKGFSTVHQGAPTRDIIPELEPYYWKNKRKEEPFIEQHFGEQKKEEMEDLRSRKKE